MKVCITSTGKELDSLVDARFGRTPYFIVVDTETNDVEVFENTCSENTQGAGTGAVSLVVDKGIDVLLTGRVGPKAAIAFQATDVKLVEGMAENQTVREALAKFTRGEYTQTGRPEQLSAGIAGATEQGPGTGMGRGMGCGGGRGMGGGGRGMGCGRGRGMGGGGRRRG